ncbi:chaperonin 10-like protein [Aspergillus spectabilis]
MVKLMHHHNWSGSTNLGATFQSQKSGEQRPSIKSIRGGSSLGVERCSPLQNSATSKGSASALPHELHGHRRSLRQRISRTSSHEGTGVVVAVGAQVSEVSSFRIGGTVMLGLARNPCGSCFHCEGPNDWHQYCWEEDCKLGINRDGAFAEYHVVNCRVTARLPESVSFQTAAPLACAGAPGERVAARQVAGLGGC